MQIQKLIKIVVTCTIVVIVFLFFNKTERIIVSKTDLAQFEHLDIIVTSGQSVQSKLLNLINFSFESYSHVGIVCKEKNKIFVLHATTDGTKENGIRYDDLQSFIDLSTINYYKIVRSENISKSMSLINQSIEEYKTCEIPFDYDFNNYNKKQIYCSELVFDIYYNNGIITSELDLNKPIHPKIFTELEKLKTVKERKYTANSNNKK